MPKVSVVIPVYNVEEFLEECLNSVINQTLKDIEIICINDASTDHSTEILQRYGHKDNRIQIVQNTTNKGLSYTRNKGLALAGGEYIYFLDSDDCVELDMLERLYERCKDDNLDIIYFDTQIIYMTDKLKNEFSNYKTTRNNKYDGVYKGCDLFEEFIRNNDFVVSVCRQFLNLQFLKKYGLDFYVGMLHEDNLFTISAILKAERVACIDKKYFKRRFRNDSIMTREASMKNVEGLFNTYYEIIKLWDKEKFNKSTGSCIDTFLNSIFKRVKYYYSLVPFDERKIPIFADEEYKRNMLFNAVISTENNNALLYGISDIKLKEIAKAKKVIIYGAGMVGKDVLRILDIHKIDVYAFAVSDLLNNPGYILRVPVKKLEDFGNDEKDSLFIVAVTKPYENEIIQNLLSHGFCNYIKIND